MERRFVGGLTVVLIVAIGLWLTVRGCAGDEPGLLPTPAPNDAAVVAPAVSVTEGTVESGGRAERDLAAAGGLSREAVAGASELDPATGSLLVRLVWADDESPVVGLEVEASRGWSDNRVDVPRGVSDARGEVLFEGLAPGIVRPRWACGVLRYASAVEIAAEARAESRVILPVGLTVRGKVVDGLGQPVAGASIVALAETFLCAAVGCSGMDGSFSVRGLPLTCTLGARKSGFAPSPMRELRANRELGDEAKITIELREPGGALEGLVLGPDGMPVVGAALRIGQPSKSVHQLVDGGYRRLPQPFLVRSDAGGRFRATGLTPGPNAVKVRATRLAPTRQTVEVRASRTSSVTLHLGRAATLLAEMVDVAGDPIAGAIVRARTLDRRHSWFLTTDPAGRCRFDELVPGKLLLTAEHSSHGAAAREVELVAGERFQWRETLGSGLELHGIVRDSAGRPVPGARVHGRLDPWVKNASWYPSVRTNQEGRFVIKDCVPQQTIRLAARRSNVLVSEVVVRGIKPGNGEVELRLPPGEPGYVAGLARGPGDRALAGVRGTLTRIDGDWAGQAFRADSATGEFRAGGFPPGRYQLRVSAAGFPSQHITGTIRAGETWDVGTLRFAAGGWVLIQLGGTGAAPDGLQVIITNADGGGARRLSLNGRRCRFGPLDVGRHRALLFGRDQAANASEFDITAGRTTGVTLPVAAGTAITLRLVTPNVAGLDGPMDVRIRDAAGQLAYCAEVASRRGPRDCPVRLRPGTYQVEASWHHHTATRSITVGAEPEVFEIVLR